MMTIKTNSTNTQAITSFLNSHEHTNHGHHLNWPAILQQGMKHKPLTLTAWRDGQVVGYLPMVKTSSLLFGNHLVSLPYLNEAGVIADDITTRNKLVQHAITTGKELGVKRLELRNNHATESDTLKPIRTDKVRMLLNLPTSPDDLWQNIGSKPRNLIRKSEKHNLQITFGNTELLNAFYKVFTVNMRDLGTPVYAKHFFKSILESFSTNAEICIVSQNQTPIAGALLLHYNGTTEVPSASALRKYNHTSANMLMYYELLKRAISRHAHTFNFGRSTFEAGTYRFKKQWGASAHTTAWKEHAYDTNTTAITATDEKYSRAIKVWQKLPVWMTKIAGPPIVRGIP